MTPLLLLDEFSLIQKKQQLFIRHGYHEVNSDHVTFFIIQYFENVLWTIFESTPDPLKNILCFYLFDYVHTRFV